jgi:Holliday junction resolvasome RuvABC endonuclease subunit
LIYAETVKGDLWKIVRRVEDVQQVWVEQRGEGGIRLSGCESPPYVNNQRVTAGLHQLVGALLYVLGRNLTLVECGAYKNAVCGNMRAKKAQVMRAVNYRLGCQLTDSNQSDAAAVAFYLIQQELCRRNLR